jgi:hypothetical protein
MGRDAGFVAPTTPHRDAGIGFEGSRELPDKRDMHKAKSKGRHRPGGQAGHGSSAGSAGATGGADASGPTAYGGPGETGPAKKNDGRR